MPVAVGWNGSYVGIRTIVGDGVMVGVVVRVGVLVGMAVIVSVAVSVGASLDALTVTVEASDSVVVSAPPLLVPPLSLTCVSVNTRLPVVGLSTLVFWYVMPLTKVCALLVEMPAALVRVTVGV